MTYCFHRSAPQHIQEEQLHSHQEDPQTEQLLQKQTNATVIHITTRILLGNLQGGISISNQTQSFSHKDGV